MRSRTGRVTRSGIGALAIIAIACLTACGLGDDPDSVKLAYYMRNLSDESFEYEIASSEGQYARGDVTREPASIGCGTVPSDWELTVRPSNGADPDAPPEARLSAAQIGPMDPVVVWVDVNPAGQVQTGLGLPVWWGADIQRCP